ncbi:FAD-dependent oxidoreductase [Parapedobacter deserti]|uniref:FAD-dependent oxidoreductase n=1 Tax=Parapedobacter deserti TaxID=1912957 RepID=A0ABV7JJ57_9SPHI
MEIKHFTNRALWSESTSKHDFPRLTGDIEVDVAIVGGGITGLSAAYNLVKSGKKVAVLEALQVGMGTTGSSTGNLYASIDEYLFTIGSKHSEEALKAVVASRLSAIDFIEQRIQEYNISCDFRRVPFYLFTTADTSAKSNQIEKEQQAAVKAGLNISKSPPENFPFSVDEIVNIPDQAQFNPLKYVSQLALALQGDNCQILENTKVLKVEEGEPCTVHTSHGTVRAKQVIMATHTPKGIYAVHTAMEPYREHAMAVKIKGELPAGGIYWHMQLTQHYSLRPYIDGSEQFLLVLGEAYKVGHENDTAQNFKKIEEYVRANFNVESIAYTWAAQHYKPADALPYIGNSPTEKNIFIATGFAADGLVYGTLSGMIISDLIMNKENPYAKMYSPTRFTPIASATKFVKENLDVGYQLVKDLLFYGDADEVKDIKIGQGKTIKLNNERLAVYRDEQGAVHLVSGICPHMGCAVHWNNGEKTWDCPCHGSRFGIDGEVLEGPAFTGLAKPKHSH